MKRLVIAVVLVACGDDGDAPKDAPSVDAPADAPVGCVAAGPPTKSVTTQQSCDPLAQTGCNSGEKCAPFGTTSKEFRCVPDGLVNEGCACEIGTAMTMAYDNCRAGLACAFGNDGKKCQRLCDAAPATSCAGAASCVAYGTTGLGVCTPECDPLTDNDFDQAGTLHTKGPGCPSQQGCYAYPSYGDMNPRTHWGCLADGPAALVHRGHPPGQGLVMNSCAPGYLPLLRESATVSETICVALCKPLNCFAGNCGTNNDNRLGAEPHRCMNPDRLGTFDTGANGEQCEFLWRREMSLQTATFKRSRLSDQVGICFDHSKYQYDANGDQQPDTPLPACADLQDGFGSGSDPGDPLTYYGAADFGCVDSSHAGLMQAAGKPRRSALDDFRPLSR